MTTHAVVEELELTRTGGDDRPPSEREERRGPGGGSPRIPQRSYLTGMVLFITPVMMFFLALTSALVVRKGLADDWAPLALPPVLWLTTAVILASSFTLEVARRRLLAGRAGAFRFWWGVTTGLGLLFLAGQLWAWRELVAQGVYIATNPSSSFFYVLTGAHGVHLLGGIVALLFVGYGSLHRLTRPTAVRVSALYWHFMGGLWVFLFGLLRLGG